MSSLVSQEPCASLRTSIDKYEGSFNTSFRVNTRGKYSDDILFKNILYFVKKDEGILSEGPTPTPPSE